MHDEFQFLAESGKAAGVHTDDASKMILQKIYPSTIAEKLRDAQVADSDTQRWFDEYKTNWCENFEKNDLVSFTTIEKISA